MKKIFISDVDTKYAHAGYKARIDVLKIMKYNNIGVVNVQALSSGKSIRGIYERVSNAINLFLTLYRNEFMVFINYPNINIYLRVLFLLKKISNIKIIAIVHDVDSLRGIKNKDKIFLRKFDVCISHNEKMSAYLYDMGVCTYVNINLFDYLVDNNDDVYQDFNLKRDVKIVFAGNLNKEKSGFLYKCEYTLDLWGKGYDKSKVNHNYLGVFDPDSPTVFLEEYSGKMAFGLIWDGDDTQQCCGPYGKYLKYNNPHKTSFYLSQNIPVIVWENAAIADFVLKNKCGIVISSLNCLGEKMNELKKTGRYAVLKNNAVRIGSEVRSGKYLTTAMRKVEELYEQ